MLLCGPRGRAAADLLPGVDEIIEWPLPWIDPDPGAGRPAGHADALTARLARRRRRRGGRVHLVPPVAAAAGAAAADGRGAAGSRDQRRLPGLAAGRPAPGAGRASPSRNGRCRWPPPPASPLPAGDEPALRLRADRVPPRAGRARRPRVRGAAPRVGGVEPGLPARAGGPDRRGRSTAAGHRVVVTGGPDERALTARVAGGRRHRPGRPDRPGRAGRRSRRRRRGGGRQHRPRAPGRRAGRAGGQPLRADRPVRPVGAVPGADRPARRRRRALPGHPGGQLPGARAPLPRRRRPGRGGRRRVADARRASRWWAADEHPALARARLLDHVVRARQATATWCRSHPTAARTASAGPAPTRGRTAPSRSPRRSCAGADVDLVILQRPEELDLAEQWLRPPARPRRAGDLRRAQHPQGRRAQHPAPDGRPRRPAASPTSPASTSCSGTPAPPAPPWSTTASSPPPCPYTGELDRLAVVINEPVRRWRVTGTDLLPRFAEIAPLDVFGMGVAGLADHLGLPADRLDQPRRRAPGPDARRAGPAAGVPAPVPVDLARAEPDRGDGDRHAGRRAGHHRGGDGGAPGGGGARHPGRHPARRRPPVHRRPGDRAPGRRAARTAARDRYGLDRFLADWDRLLEEEVCASR